MHSKGSRFTMGVWGLRVCSFDVAFMFATVRSRWQAFATVRAIPVWPCLWYKFCRRSHYWRFHMWRCFISRGRHGTSLHLDMFCNVLKIVLWQAQYFCDLFRRCVAVFVAGAALWRSIIILRGRRRTSDVSCCLRMALSGHIKWRQGANSMASVAFCEM